MSPSSIVVLAVLIAVVLAIYSKTGAKKKKQKLERSPTGIMNRAIGQSERPDSELQRHDQAFAATWAKEILEAADKVVILDTEF